MYVKALKWPIITWVVINVLFLVVLLLLPKVGEIATDATLTPLLLAVGIWAGYKMVQFGGNYWHAALGGLIVGAVCAILAIVLFGLIASAGVANVLPGAVYDFAMNFFGALIGGGFAVSKPTST